MPRTHGPIPAIRVLQFRQVINAHRQLDISGRGNDTEFPDSVESTAPVACSVEADDFLACGRLCEDS